MEGKMLEQVITEAIKTEINNRMELAIQQAQKTLERDIEEMVAQVSLHVLSQVSFERYGTDLMIKVKIDKGDK
jgi:hypothetical protein